MSSLMSQSIAHSASSVKNFTYWDRDPIGFSYHSECSVVQEVSLDSATWPVKKIAWNDSASNELSLNLNPRQNWMVLEKANITVGNLHVYSPIPYLQRASWRLIKISWGPWECWSSLLFDHHSSLDVRDPIEKTLWKERLPF